MPSQGYVLRYSVFLLTRQTLPAALLDHLNSDSRAGFVLPLILLLLGHRVRFGHWERQKQIEEHGARVKLYVRRYFALKPARSQLELLLLVAAIAAMFTR